MNFRTYQVARSRNYATPSGVDVHHDVLLSNLAVAAFDTGVDGFIGDMLAPVVPVDNQSNKYPILGKGAFLRVHDGKRAPKTRARIIEFDVSSDAYFCDEYALGAEIPLQDLANADKAFGVRENHNTLVNLDLRRGQELRLAQLLGSASNMTSGAVLTGANKWSDYINSDPLGDVTTAASFMRSRTGLIPNTAAMDWDTFQILTRHPDLLELYKYTQGGMVTADQIKAAFKIDRLLIANSVMENQLEGLGASSMTNVWGNKCLIAHIEQATTMQTRTLALRFRWTPEGYPAPFAVGTKQYAGPGERNVEILEAGYFQTEKIIAPDLGYVIDGTI